MLLYFLKAAKKPACFFTEFVKSMWKLQLVSDSNPGPLKSSYAFSSDSHGRRCGITLSVFQRQTQAATRNLMNLDLVEDWTSEHLVSRGVV